ncbi:MAG: F0F1 ATP synthase subunit B [Clostridiales bacterium]|nr:F0F1 ATP synthase subunit B [Clostridiales bacterium]
MPTLDVISINLWDILISFMNLAILYLILRRFLYKPVRNLIAQRRAEVESQYAEAEIANNNANIIRDQWQKRLDKAEADSDMLVKISVANADKRNEMMLAETREKADRMMRRAQEEIEREQKKAEASMKKEIIDVSTSLTEKLIEREIKTEDHRDLIDSFINDLGEE